MLFQNQSHTAESYLIQTAVLYCCSLSSSSGVIEDWELCPRASQLELLMEGSVSHFPWHPQLLWGFTEIDQSQYKRVPLWEICNNKWYLVGLLFNKKMYKKEHTIKDISLTTYFYHLLMNRNDQPHRDVLRRESIHS